MVGTTNGEDKSQQPTEEDALDRAITSIDPMLRASLQREQKRRRLRAVITGGIVMGTLLSAVIASYVISGGATTPSGQDQDQPQTRLDRAEQAATLSSAGWKLWQSGDAPAAEKKFAAAVKLDPDLDAAWNGLGWSQIHLGDFDKAFMSFSRCLELTPDHPGALNGAGQAKLMQRKYEDAEKMLLRAAPKAPAAWYGLARLYLLTDEYAKAEQWLQKLLEQDSAELDKPMLQNLLTAAKQQKLSPALRTSLEPPAQTADTSAAAKLSTRGWRSLSTGKPRAAEIAFRESLQQAPDHAPAINGLGFALLNQGKPATAKPQFERLLEAQPEHAGGKNGLARCLKELGETEKALALWKEMDQQLKNVNAGTWGLATTHFEQEQFQAALPYLERIVKATPDNAQAKNMLERCRAETADVE